MIPSLVKTDHEDFYKDQNSQAVINTNLEAYTAYKKQRDRLLRADKVFDEVESLKTELSEIKQLLSAILTKV